MSATTPHPAHPTGVRAMFNRFFFAEEVPYGLAIMRIVLPLVLLLVVVPRWTHSREFFSTDGAAAPLAINYGYWNMLPEPSGIMAVALMTALVFFLVATSLGWFTRVSVTASFLLYTYLNLLDCLSTFTKYSVIASHLLLLLCLSSCGAVWSLDAWRRGSRGTAPPRFPVWPRRLAQLLIGIIYFGSAITKIHTPTFFSGDQLRFWMMSNLNNSNPVGEQMTLFPVLLVGFAYVAAVWEITFLFTAWRGWGRRLMLAMGVAFHFMTTLTLGLYIFPLVCLCSYFAFINQADVQAWKTWLARFRRRGEADKVGDARRTRRTGPVYAGLLAAIVAIGVEAEYQLDPYGERQIGGPAELEELDPKAVERMLAPGESIRPNDLVHSLELGTWLIGGYVINHRTTFEQGEYLYAQCTLNPPHPDVRIECNLHDADDQVLDEVEQVVPRESFRANFLYRLTDALTPGDYSLVIRCGGQEVLRRRIKLLPRLGSPVAN